MHVPTRSNGFTLVELLLVVSLIAVLSSFLIPGFSNYINNQNIRQGQELLKSDLRTAQNKALTGVGSSSSTVNYWGLKIPSADAQSYIYFQSNTNDGSACDGAVTDETSGSLPGDVVVKDANGTCVFFSLRNGDATIINLTGGGDTLSVGYPGENACYGVQINSVGMIRGVNLCP
ncbi:prepilin-type N-terminal cleavage/methylation domain-containing protein [candidate division WWE3 bacterium]|jgi:prepilin-type N-terminal cleavage/methylation domain-containing protein|nr:prepilin-type N-terminal cleavage/methylation domain-containing protein [candidate division WWE3 bacterium]MBT7349208.1 prepilin-type N-terminal cleavage/methylation domain-containing protein [candidate division WWE3 bacterium]